jgi:hypothetical protein
MRQNTGKLGQVNFFKVCELMRTHREEIEKTCNSQSQAAAYLSQKIGAKVSTSTLENIAEATGIKLTLVHQRTGGNTKFEAAKNRCIMIRAIVRLYEEIGTPLPEDLAILYEKAFGRPYSRPVLVASIPPSSTIPITKKA